ncbi:MAG: hypothetical protein U9P70_03975 [Patescibacteria group bacterium]|nr:hypothetical protein [Patescibacteria group bacterium]
MKEKDKIENDKKQEMENITRMKLSKYIDKIDNFCFERKNKDISRALKYVSSNFESTATLFTLLLEKYDTLGINIQDKSNEIDPYKQAGFLIVDQSRFIFIATMSSLEFTAKKISLKEGSPIKKFLDEKNKKKYYYLKDIMQASASEKLNLITADEKKEWDFFIDIRNALVHNNAIVDKNLDFKVYDELYSFKKDGKLSGDIQSLFIFSKRIVELFYNWSQKHEDSLRF